MKTENDQENPSGGQEKPRTRGGALGDDESKGVNADSASEPARARGGAVGDDCSKGLEENPKA